MRKSNIFGGICALLLVIVPATSHELQMTIYDDGRSCPGGCDAHVVLNDAQNGTSHAYVPETAAAPQKCRNGQMCRICFGHNETSCMDVLYRGEGPPLGKVDFTPAFYQENCGNPGVPSALEDQCKALDESVMTRGYDTRLNCVGGDTDPKCRSIVERAQAEYDADLTAYEDCVERGQPAYNAAQPDATTRRKYGCAYSMLKLGGPNRNGDRWHKLSPAACRPGSFVGRDGLDCCGGQPRVEAALHPECVPYYPRP